MQKVESKESSLFDLYGNMHNKYRPCIMSHIHNISLGNIIDAKLCPTKIRHWYVMLHVTSETLDKMKKKKKKSVICY